MAGHRKDYSWFIRGIAEGDTELEPAVLKQIGCSMGISLDGKYFFCVALGISDPSIIAEQPYILQKLQDIWAKLFGNREVYSYIGARFSLILLISGTDEERIPITDTLIYELSRFSFLPVRIGVGRAYKDIEKWIYSRVEAYEALCSMETASGIAYIDDIYAKHNITLRKVDTQKRKVTELFRSGKLEEMILCVKNLVEQVRRESPVRQGQPYPTSIRRTILELTAELLHISSDIGVNVDALVDCQTVYASIFESPDTPTILDRFQKLAALLYEEIWNITDKADSNMLWEVENYIHQHLEDQNLDLSMICRHLGITLPYFSAFFIREKGVGCNEYISTLRIYRAQTMLQETSMKIKDIAQACGFQSANYFTVVFHKYTGVTPSQYRKRKQ